MNRVLKHFQIDQIPQGAGLVIDDSGQFTPARFDPKRRSRSVDDATVSTPAPAATHLQTLLSTSGITEAATPACEIRRSFGELWYKTTQ